jgi:hypothetical protein
VALSDEPHQTLELRAVFGDQGVPRKRQQHADSRIEQALPRNIDPSLPVLLREGVERGLYLSPRRLEIGRAEYAGLYRQTRGADRPAGCCGLGEQPETIAIEQGRDREVADEVACEVV